MMMTKTKQSLWAVLLMDATALGAAAQGVF